MKLDLDKRRKYVVAFSGGADSALLSYLLKEQQYSFRLIHVSHSDSKASANSEAIKGLCRTFAQHYDVDLSIIEAPFDVDSSKKLGTEAAERNSRYSLLFGSMADDEVLLTGHHLDDSIETFFFRLCRGTSVKGLTGISRISENSRLIRPLISIKKSEIQQLVTAAAVLYGHDSLNDNTELSRGFIRNKIIPELVGHFSDTKFYASLQRVMGNMSECSSLIEDLYNMDIQLCGSNSTGIHRKIFSSLSEQRQRNFIYHLVSTETGIFLSRNAIEEIRKRVNISSKSVTFEVSKVTVVLNVMAFFVKNSQCEVNTEWMIK